ncbi:uncharacterized protein LOC115956655 [Quercus lobata]|uniref:uncharacterized protein LOC115956651 n=1 Tax=Quercus lobata TaxID=97700 RepID=UPI0012450ECA|nr:uncharacterized protein LOC115956651 [Quercus lobata]XP_030930827.1 uncharacterized protein LOC115956655 [Quercus lobata]
MDSLFLLFMARNMIQHLIRMMRRGSFKTSRPMLHILTWTSRSGCMNTLELDLKFGRRLMASRFLRWLPKHRLSIPSRCSLEIWCLLIDNLTANDMTLNPWVGCEKYAECEWALELNNR